MEAYRFKYYKKIPSRKHVFVFPPPQSRILQNHHHNHHLKQAYLIFTKNIFLFKGEQNNISVVCWMLQMSVISSILENTGSFVDYPVWTEHRQDHTASNSPSMYINVHCHRCRRMGHKTHRKEFRHPFMNFKMPVPVFALIFYQHKLHYFSTNS